MSQNNRRDGKLKLDEEMRNERSLTSCSKVRFPTNLIFIKIKTLPSSLNAHVPSPRVVSSICRVIWNYKRCRRAEYCTKRKRFQPNPCASGSESSVTQDLCCVNLQLRLKWMKQSRSSLIPGSERCMLSLPPTHLQTGQRGAGRHHYPSSVWAAPGGERDPTSTRHTLPDLTDSPIIQNSDASSDWS